MLEETLSYLAESLEDLLVPEAPQDAKGKTLHKVCVFDYRSVPTRGVGDLPLVVSLTDGRMVGVSGETV